MSECDPPGAPPQWRSRDAMRRAACRPAAWAHPRWAAPALLTALAVAAAVAPEALGAMHDGPAAVRFHWLFGLPELTLVAPVLAALLTWRMAPEAASSPRCCCAGAAHSTACGSAAGSGCSPPTPPAAYGRRCRALSRHCAGARSRSCSGRCCARP
ncbi:hypothetical protein [Streptomyces sp. NPDC001070]